MYLKQPTDTKSSIRFCDILLSNITMPRSTNMPKKALEGGLSPHDARRKRIDYLESGGSEAIIKILWYFPEYIQKKLTDLVFVQKAGEGCTDTRGFVTAFVVVLTMLIAIANTTGVQFGKAQIYARGRMQGSLQPGLALGGLLAIVLLGLMSQGDGLGCLLGYEGEEDCNDELGETVRTAILIPCLMYVSLSLYCQFSSGQCDSLAGFVADAAELAIIALSVGLFYGLFGWLVHMIAVEVLGDSYGVKGEDGKLHAPRNRDVIEFSSDDKATDRMIEGFFARLSDSVSTTAGVMWTLGVAYMLKRSNRALSLGAIFAAAGTGVVGGITETTPNILGGQPRDVSSIYGGQGRDVSSIYGGEGSDGGFSIQ